MRDWPTWAPKSGGTFVGSAESSGISKTREEGRRGRLLAEKTLKRIEKEQRIKAANRAWAATAIGLGVWETTAVTTKKVPTITKTCQAARGKYRRRAELVMAAWLLGLTLHLFKQN